MGCLGVQCGKCRAARELDPPLLGGLGGFQPVRGFLNVPVSFLPTEL